MRIPVSLSDFRSQSELWIECSTNSKTLSFFKRGQMTTLPSYGSLTQQSQEENDTTKHFDANNAYYLKSSTPRTPTKLLLLIIPILLAVLVMGTISYLLLRDFNSLYPGRGGDQHPYYTKHGSHGSDTSPQPKPETDGGSSNNGDVTVSSNDDAACSAHEACKALVGDCCPNPAGTSLYCCDGR